MSSTFAPVFFDVATGALLYDTGNGPVAVPLPNGGSNLPPSGARQLLTANLDLYISPLGSDANDGESAATSMLNADHAYAWVRDNIDLGGHVVTLHVLGSYSGIAGWTFKGPLVGAIGPESFVIDGGSVSGTIIAATASLTYLFQAQDGAKFTVQNMTLQSSGAGSADLIVSEGVIAGGNLWFGPTGNAFVDVAGPRSLFTQSGPLTFLINSNPNIGFVAEDHGQIDLNGPLVVSGNPHWGTAFVQADLGGMIDATGSTVTPAAASGRRYNASQNGIVFTGGSGGPNFFPGDVAGAVSSGGWYQ